ncbi:MAG: DUF3341 domain-containing protein [Acidobacteriia bacterium]|nr:DUF3341 domain-containing protein [Terriglobia bacterium]
MATVNSIYGLFPGPHAAERGMNALRAAGVAPNKIVVMSPEPFEEYGFAQADRPKWMGWLAPLGGIVGGVTGFSLAWYTQTAYPLVTGGMPIVAPWPTGIITYELTMLGAILTTILTLLVGSRLPNWKPKLYDPEVSHGKILIGVLDPSVAARADLETRLRGAGASEVKVTSRSAAE